MLAYKICIRRIKKVRLTTLVNEFVEEFTPVNEAKQYF